MSRKFTQKEYENLVCTRSGNEYRIISTYNGMDKPIKIRHNKCGNEYELKCASYLVYQKYRCSCMYNISYVDIVFPHLARNFKNQAETHIPKSSKKIVELICPCCNKIVKSRVVNYIRMGHVPCRTCGDGFYYPEKFMANILQSLNIQYITQFSPSWCHPYKYDFQFEYNSLKYIIEMDGGIGHGNSETAFLSLEESIQRDKEKDLLAKKNGYILIRIDCNYIQSNRFKYIKESITESLKNVFPINEIDWDSCNLKSQYSKFLEVIEVYRTKTKYVSEIAKIVNIKPRTVYKYLFDAMNENILEKEIILKHPFININHLNNVDFISIIDESNLSQSIKIYCFEDVLFFNSITDAAIYYGFSRDSLYQALEKNNGYFKGRHFIKTIELPNNFKAERKVFPQKDYCNSGSKKIICQYTLSNELKHIYIRKEELPKNMLYGNIFRVCSGSRTTAYGYKWQFMDKNDEFEIFSMIKDNEILRYYFCN